MKKQPFQRSYNEGPGTSEFDPHVPDSANPSQYPRAIGAIYKNLAKRAHPWWVIITAWLIFGLPLILGTLQALFPAGLPGVRNGINIHYSWGRGSWSFADIIGAVFAAILWLLLMSLIFIPLCMATYRRIKEDRKHNSKLKESSDPTVQAVCPQCGSGYQAWVHTCIDCGCILKPIHSKQKSNHGVQGTPAGAGAPDA